MSNRKSGAKGVRGGEDFKQEDILQAVVVIENFDNTFLPVTLDRPRSLLPLCNTPLIEYTLECLSANGIQRAIVYCCTHAEQVKTYLSNSKWTKWSEDQMSTPTMSVLVVVAEECRSMGDVLRDVDHKSLVHSDFLLVTGGLVSNSKLKPIVEEHKRRRQLSKNAIMTLVYKQAPPGHPLRSARRDVIIAVHSQTQHIVGYQRVGVSKKFRIPLDVFDVPLVQLRYDLFDCQISICSTVVPQLMTDNFDFQSIDDFIRGILVSEEILDNTLHVNVLPQEDYAMSVVDPYTYDVVSQDVMSRWTYPLTPDNNILGHGAPDDRYVYQRRNVYLQRDVTLSHNSTLEGNVTIGRGSSVDAGSKICRSVIGRNCRIGKNVNINGCYLWDNIQVDDGCQLEDCIIDCHVHLKEGTTAGPVCIIGRGVCIGQNVTLCPRSTYINKLTAESLTKSDAGLHDAYLKKCLAFTCDGDNKMLRFVVVDSDEHSMVNDGWQSMVVHSDGEEEEEDEDEDDDDKESDGVEMEQAHDASNDADDDTDNLYYQEIIVTLERALEENIDTENVILEINSIKCAYDVQIRELTMIVMKSLLDLPLRSLASGQNTPTQPQYVAEFKKHFGHFKSLFKNYIKTPRTETDALLAMEKFSRDSAVTPGMCAAVVTYLYKDDVLSEDGIMMWWEADEDDEEERNEEVRKKCAPFVEWLKTAEEDSD